VLLGDGIMNSWATLDAGVVVMISVDVSSVWSLVRARGI
jgi:hypothetical protein